jgi:hypothetical protein
VRFEIRIAGTWNPIVAEEFADVDARVEAGCVVLTAELDQSALHGLLERVRALHLELIDVRRTRSRRLRNQM